jgi:hypothetical protein
MAQPSGSAADFPYDEHLHAESLRGLDRLRAIPDRKLAEYLYRLHALAEHNETQQPESPARAVPGLEALRRAAKRALVGKLGLEARELADCLLLDQSGRERLDRASLEAFGGALRELRRSQR